MSNASEYVENVENRTTEGQAGQRIEQAEPARDTVPAAATTEQEEREFRAGHRADRMPTPEEEQAAEAHGPVDPEVAARAREAAERGASVKGEGEIA
jgi:hypothetical protein